MIQFELEDGSVYTFLSAVYEAAWKMKHGEFTSEHEKMIRSEVSRLWKEKKVPTKFGYESWESHIYDEEFWAPYQKEQKEVWKMFHRMFGKKYKNYCISPVGTNVEKEMEKFEPKFRRTYLILVRGTQECDKYLKEEDKIRNKFNALSDMKARKRIENREADVLFKNHAELCERLIYQELRGYIMGMCLSELTKGKAKTLLVGKDKLTEVTKFTATERNPEEIFGDEK